MSGRSRTGKRAVTKICTTCKVEKPDDAFHAKADAKDGLHPHCKACRKVKDAAYRVANAERAVEYEQERGQRPERKAYVKARNRAAYEADKPKYWAQSRQYAVAHPDAVRKTKREYKARNPVKTLIDVRERQARKLNATPAWANQFFIEEAYELARLRTQLTGIEWQVDHIVPLRHPRVQGLHVEFNLQVIPAKVNQKKGNRYWPDMPSGVSASL